MSTTDIASEQLAAAGALMKKTLHVKQLSESAKMILSEITFYVRRYWWWGLYFLILRKLFRVIRGPRRSRRHDRRSRSGETRDGDSNSEPRAYYSSMAPSGPGHNPVIVGDGVIVVNRNDRYVEVYERKNVTRVDNVDDQVQALLREFQNKSRY